MIMLRRSALAGMILMLGAVGSAHAGMILHFENGTAPGRFPLVNSILDEVGIGSKNVASETSATSFLVPGQGLVDLTFTFQDDRGSFLFSFGFYDIAGVTADPIQQKRDYAVQALSSSNATLVFDERLVNPGAKATFSVEGGTELGFFLIPFNTLEFFQKNPDDFYSGSTRNQLRSPLFSVSDANPGEFDQFLSFVANGITLFTWEDLTRAGRSDNSFLDMAFTIDVEMQPQTRALAVVVPKPSSFLLASMAGLTLGAVSFWRRRSNAGVSTVDADPTA